MKNLKLILAIAAIAFLLILLISRSNKEGTFISPESGLKALDNDITPLMSSIPTLHVTKTSETPPKVPTSTEEVPKSVIGEYTNQDIEAALDDYFNIGTLGLPEPKATYVAYLKGIFDTQEISDIDALMHNFIFDNSISRADKISALWAVYHAESNTGAQSDYLLQTLSMLRPIELNDEIPASYLRCNTTDCQTQIVTLAGESNGIIESDSSGKITSLERDYIEKKKIKLGSFIAEQFKNVDEHNAEILEPLATRLLVFFDRETGIKMLEDKMQKGKDFQQPLLPSYITMLIGSSQPNLEKLKSALAQTSQITDTDTFDKIVATIQAAKTSLPLTAETANILDTFLQQTGYF